MALRPTCLILGLDGIDPDVLVNLLSFYTGCGFNTRVASEPANCELLVIQRGHALPGWLCPQVRGEVHVYDYVCNGSSDLAHAFPQATRVRVISPTGQPSGSSPVPQDWLVASPHPVVSALWAPRGRLAPRAERSYGLVHIGHRKPNPAGDYWQQEIQQLAGYTNCHFWGQGWASLAGNLPQEHLHGPSSLHETQGIYRNAQAALGVMHEFQRGRTLSGRMWQAPLNGCLLYTEAVPPGMKLPGVQVVSGFSTLPSNDSHPEALVEDARAHWDGVTERLARTLGLQWHAPGRLGLARLYLQQVALRHVKVSLERSRAAWGLGPLQKARA
jgi:hypothetical protein